MNRPLNLSHVKQHCLRCSKTTGRRFERVSSSFLEEITAEVEMVIRSFRQKYKPPVHEVVDHGTDQYVTGELMDHLKEEINNMIARLIQSKVQQHPSKGRTLQGR